MKMFVLMCSETPMHVTFSSKQNAMNLLELMRAEHYKKSGCSQSMSFTNYKYVHTWYLRETTFDVVPERRREGCSCGVEKCRYPKCSTGYSDEIIRLSEIIHKRNMADVEIDFCDRDLALEVLREQRETEFKHFVPIVECSHKWEVGIIKNKRVAQCSNCLKVEIVNL